MTEATENHLPEHEQEINLPTRTGRWGLRIRSLLIAVVILGATAGILYGINYYMRPPIPDDLPPSVKVDLNKGVAQPVDLAVMENAITGTITQEQIDAAEHPLDPLLEMAKRGLERIDAEVQDYTAIMQKQVRVKGKLMPEGYMRCKIRHARDGSGAESPIPFSVYTYFLKPRNLAGQEAIWVDGHFNGKLVAHAHGLLNFKRFYLSPTGRLAMDGNLHPITDMGMRNLIRLLIEKGIRDRQYDECEVTMKRNVDVGGHACTMFQVTHPNPRDHFEFHIAKIFIDDERNLPIAYEGYLWPENPGEKPPLLEKYYYTDIELNVGLTDEDFDPSNEEYNYPAN